MNLTTEELIKLVEDHDAKAVEFEKNIVKYKGLERSELDEYNTSSMIVLLGLLKLKQSTVDEVLESCLNHLHK